MDLWVFRATGICLNRFSGAAMTSKGSVEWDLSARDLLKWGVCGKLRYDVGFRQRV